MWTVPFIEVIYLFYIVLRIPHKPSKSLKAHVRMSLDNTSADWPKYHGYRPLSSWRREIRLLKFDRLANQHHRTGEGDLKFSLEHAELDDWDRTTYYALSYNWGADPRMTSIVVDGQPVRVRYTLYHFLHCFCDEWTSGEIRPSLTPWSRLPSELWFWLDALCIDQYNDTEKGEQIKIMGDIYRGANGVVSWIGEPTSRSDDFLDLVFTGPYQVGWPSWWSLPSRHQRIVREGLEDVLSRPYWSRLWILQEVALAQRVDLLCGRRRCAWDELKGPIEYLRLDNGLSSLDTWITLKESNVVWEELRRHENWKPRESPLVRIVLKFSKARCGDPRDKLYGLLSMAGEPYRSSIPVSYDPGKRAWDVLLDFWAHYVKYYPNAEEVQQRRVIGLVWVLWFQMEIQGIPPRERFDTCVIDAMNLRRILGFESFRVKARPLFRYQDPKLTVTADGQLELGLCDRRSLFDYRPAPDAFASSATTSRRWLVVSERLEPADICYVVENQPSNISWEGEMETLPNQTMIIFRVDSHGFRCVGRGKELIPGTPFNLAVAGRFSSQARYELHSRHDPQWIRH